MKMTTPNTAIISPGTTNDNPQFVLTKYPAKSPPTIFPIDVCEFHIPNTRPFFPFPNQFATTVTTPGQPDVCTTPHAI